VTDHAAPPPPEDTPDDLAEDPAEGQAPLIDEAAALRAARLVATRRATSPEEVAALRADVLADLPRIDAAARAWTRLGADLPPTTARVVGRTAWVRENLSAMRGAFDPIRARMGRRHSKVGSLVLGTQLGALLGLLSTKVLGQFVLPLGGPGGGQLLVVGPNVLDLGDDHGALAGDIRRTVVLHEVTHRLQFDATPWLGDHLRGLLGRYLEHARVDRNAIAELAPRLPEAIARVRDTGSVQPLLETVLTPEQLEIVAEAQGLMTLLEGHGNAAMYEAADNDLIADPEGVRSAMAARRDDVTTKILTAVAGLELKRRQYREGEAFVREVIDLAGVDGLNRAFAAPENLPRAEDVEDPPAWLARVTT
jgi:coenzyme F420 biosynthesis associated uncharacterized protein